MKYGLLLVLCLCGLFVLSRFDRQRRSPQADDARIRELLAKPGAVEARSWLESAPNGSRSVGGGETDYPHTKAIALVRELYRRGASKVTAIRVVIEKAQDGTELQYTNTLIAELPDDPKVRKRLFDLDASESQPEYGSARENGQRYFMMWWD
jgi:hypothetical protein